MKASASTAARMKRTLRFMACRPVGESGCRGSWLASCGRLVLENAFARFAEPARDAEGQRQARVVLAGLQRVHRLPGHVQLLGERALRPATPFAQFAQAVVHT